MDSKDQSLELTNVLASFTHRFYEIIDYREVALTAIETIGPDLLAKKQHEVLAKSQNPELVGLKSYFENALKIGLPEREVVKIVQKFNFIMESSCLVFVHSLFDAGLFDLCKKISEFRPDLFDDLINKKEIKFNLIDAFKFDPIKEKSRQLNNFLAQFERDSIKKKIITIFELCPKDIKVEGFKFDMGRILKFDKVRHIIIHGSSKTANDENKIMINIEEEMKYIRFVFEYLFYRAASNLGYKIFFNYAKLI
ncbi:MAG TPA: hypothetical protein VHY08_10975 [Bacillota bacterium]|nr:hypothetical protein [Bacillota bacterium]